MKASSYTKKLRLTYWILRLIDWLILFSPIIIYFIVAMFNHDVATLKKVVLASTLMIVIVICLINVIAQKKLRSPIWIILIGLYATKIDILPLIIIIAVATCLDEFILMPLIVNTREKLNGSKVIDARMTEDGRIE